MTSNVVGRAVLTISGTLDRASMTAAGQQAESALQRTGRNMTRLGSQLTRTVTLPLVGLGALAVREFSGFETSLFRINQLAGVSKEELDRISPSIREIGVAAGIGPADAADAFFFLQSGIGDTDLALEALDAASKGAAVGLGSIEELSRSTVSVLAAYGDEAGSAADIMETFGSAAQQAVLGPEELAAGLQRVIPSAAQAGVDLDDLAATMAAVSPAFQSGAEAGTGLFAALRAIQAPTEQAKELLDEAGTSAAELQRITSKQGLSGALEFLGEAFDGNQEALSRTLGSSEAARAAMALLGRDADDVAGIFSAVEEKSFDLGEGFDEVSQTSAQQFKVAIAELRDALVDFGAIIAPVVVRVAGVFGSIGRALNDLSPQAQTLVVVGAAIAAALGPVLVIVGTLITSIGAIAGVMGGVGIAVVAPIAALVAIGVAIGILLARSEKFRAAFVQGFQEIRAAVAPVLAEIADLITGDLIPAWEAIEPIVVPVIETIATFLLNTLVAGIKGVIQAVQGFVQVISGAIDVVAGLLTGDFGRAWDGVKKIFVGAINVIVGIFKAFLNLSIIGLVRRIFVKGLVKLISVGWRALVGLFKKNTGAIGKIFTGALRLYIKIWVSIFKGIGKAVVAGVKLIGRLIVGFINLIRGQFAALPKTLRSLMGRAWNAAMTATTSGIRAIGRIIAGLPRAILSVGQRMFNAGRDLIGRVFAGIRSAASAAGGLVADIASRLRSSINSILALPLTIGPVKALGKTIVPQVTLIPRFQQGVEDFAGGLALVGETGPELVTLPRRASVTPADETQRALGASNISVTQNFFGPTTSGGRLREIDWTLRYATSARRETVAGVAR